MTILHTEFKQRLMLELESAQALHQLLTQERELLDPPQLHALKAIQQKKQQQLQRLKKLTEERCSWLDQQQIPLDQHCIEHSLLRHQDEQQQAELVALWQQLADQFIENRKQTDVLSGIVLQARARTQNLLKILRGQKNAPNLYTKNGQAMNTDNSSGYAKA